MQLSWDASSQDRKERQGKDKKKDSPKLLACGGYQVVAGPTQGKERSVIAVEFGEGVGRWKRIESETGEWWFVRRSGESVCRVLCGRNVVSFHARRTATRRPSSRGPAMENRGSGGDEMLRFVTPCRGTVPLQNSYPRDGSL